MPPPPKKKKILGEDLIRFIFVPHPCQKRFVCIMFVCCLFVCLFVCLYFVFVVVAVLRLSSFWPCKM